MRIEIMGPPVGLSGGPSSFRAALERALAEAGHTLETSGGRHCPDAVLVIGGTRHLARLAHLKRAGTTTVLRLDGIPTAGWSQLRARARARQLGRVVLILFIRAILASKVIYQSQFSYAAWHSLPLGRVGQPESRIILNGTELDLFTPAATKIDQIAVVEGSISTVDGGVAIVEGVSRAFTERHRTETFLVCGRIEPADHAHLETLPNVRVVGALTRQQVSTEVGLSRASLSLENEPACPNAVIESLSAGTPVVGFETGAMAELVDRNSGVLVPMEVGSDRASAIHIQRLTHALERVLDKHAEFSRAARGRSEREFNIDVVAARYVEFMSAGPLDRLPQTRILMVKTKLVRPLTSRPVRHLTPRYVRARLTDVRYRRSHPDEPWLTPTVVRFLDQFLRSSDRGLEVGSGRSTAWFASRLAHLVSIESNPDWYHRVQTMLENSALSGKVELVQAIDLDRHLEVIRGIQDDSLDFCLIDGKFRGATAVAALPKVRPGGVLVVDDVHRYLPDDASHSPHARRSSDGPDGADWEDFLHRTRTWREFRTSNGVKDTALWIRSSQFLDVND